MMPVLPPNFSMIQARVNLVNSLASYSYIENLYYLLGWNSKYASLTDAQKKYFYAMHPIFLTLEGVFRRIRMVASFLMFVTSVWLSLPVAGVGLGFFTVAVPYLMPMLIVAAGGMALSFFLSLITFVSQEIMLSRQAVRIPLDNIDSLTRDFEPNRDRVNDVMRKIDVTLQYCRTHEKDKKVKRVLKNMKILLNHVERSFLYEPHLGAIVYAIVEQVEADNKSVPEEMQQLMRAFNTTSLTKLTADFMSASYVVSDLLDDISHFISMMEASAVAQNGVPTDSLDKFLQDMLEKQRVISEKQFHQKDHNYAAIDYLSEYSTMIHDSTSELSDILAPMFKKNRKLSVRSNVGDNVLKATSLVLSKKPGNIHRTKSYPVSKKNELSKRRH